MRKFLVRSVLGLLAMGGAAVAYGATSNSGAEWFAEATRQSGITAVVDRADVWLKWTGISELTTSARSFTAEWQSDAGTRIVTLVDFGGDLLKRGSLALGLGSEPADQLGYRFHSITRGDVLSSVVATGTLQPVATVLVGTQVSGQVADVPADFNSTVQRGDVIAIIDPVSFEIAVDQAAADLEVAEAAVLTAEAELLKARADLDTATATYDSAQAEAHRILVQVKDFEKDAGRKTVLAANGNLPAAERDRAEAALDMARAQYESLLAQEEARKAAVRAAQAVVKASESRIANAGAAVRQRQAALRQAKTDLERTVIRAPVDGVVILREIDPGQTVAASLQAPTLFTIAQDLREMQVDASIDESEIGRIVPGQEVHFTVDAYPEERFTGTVTQIRLSPRTAQNVVTYTVIVTAENPDLLLMPGMTATARFLVAEKRNVLKVPTAALRVRIPGAPAGAQNGVWVEDGDGSLRRIPVQVGLSDGTEAEVSGPGLGEGQRVVVGIDAPRRTRSAAKRLIGSF